VLTVPTASRREQLVGVLVGVPDELALQPDELDLVVVDPRDELRRPELAEEGELRLEVDDVSSHALSLPLVPARRWMYQRGG
jgi:hypothetical protein